MLTKLSLDPLLDQELEGRHRVVRELNTEVPYIQYLDRWIVKTFDYINRVTKRSAFGLQGYLDTLSRLIAMHLLDRSCMIV